MVRIAVNIVYATRATIPFASAASVNTMRMCECLAELGHDVTLAIGAKFWRRHPSEAEVWKFYGVEPQFRIERFLELPRCGLWFDSAIVRYAASQRSLLYARYIRILPAALRASIPTILEIHSLPDRYGLETLRRVWDASKLLGVVVLTEALQRDLQIAMKLASNDKILIAPDAVSPGRFASPDTQDDSSVAAGYVGSFYPGKGLEVILPLAERCRDVDFQIFGGTPDLVHRYSQASVATPNLKWHGYIPPAEMASRFNSFQIALLPNQPVVNMVNGDDIGRYTSPMKLFEYMAAGKAIVASDLPVLREVLTDRVNALLVPHNDPQAWAAVIELLKNNVELRHSLGCRARTDAIEKYSYESRFRRILGLYDPAGSQFGRKEAA